MSIRRDTYPFTEQDIRYAELLAKDARIAELEANYARAEAVAVRIHALTKPAMDRIAALEAANAICRTDIEALMSSCDKLEARNAELEAEVARLTAANAAWEEKYWEAQERYEDPSLSDREAMIYGD